MLGCYNLLYLRRKEKHKNNSFRLLYTVYAKVDVINSNFPVMF